VLGGADAAGRAVDDDADGVSGHLDFVSAIQSVSSLDRGP
jgi:hypothetical protein